jgi:hypothetical protein
MLPANTSAIFDGIPEAQRYEWAKSEATLDQICPQVRHETSAVRNEILRLLRNWWNQTRGS